MKYYEINETAAKQAREMWSFREYEHGSKTAEYRKQVDAVYSIVDQLPDSLNASKTTQKRTKQVQRVNILPNCLK